MGFDKDQSLFLKDSRVGDKSCEQRILSTILYHVQTFLKLAVCLLIINRYKFVMGSRDLIFKNSKKSDIYSLGIIRAYLIFY